MEKLYNTYNLLREVFNDYKLNVDVKMEGDNLPTSSFIMITPNTVPIGQSTLTPIVIRGRNNDPQSAVDISMSMQRLHNHIVMVEIDEEPHAVEIRIGKVESEGVDDDKRLVMSTKVYTSVYKL